MRRLSDLVRTVDETQEEFVVFEASDRRADRARRDRVAAEPQTILRRYGVPGDRSHDLDRRRKQA